MKFIYKGNANKSGIYCIKNILSDKIYIGQAKNFKVRWGQYKQSLAKDCTHNRHLQNDFNKCLLEIGNDDFLEFHVLEIMEYSSKEERCILEEFWIKKLLKEGRELYNFQLKVDPKQVWPKDPETMHEKMSRAAKETWSKRTQEEKEVHCNKMRSARTEETFKKISESNKKAFSKQEYKVIRSKRSKEMWKKKNKKEKEKIIKALEEGRTKEVYEKISQSNKGKHVSEETKKKMSKSKKGKYAGRNHPMFGKHHSRKSKRRMSLARKGKYAGKNHPRAKIYDHIQLCSPDGVIYTKIECVSEFAREHGLFDSSLCALLKRKIKSHKGWKLLL